MQAAFGELTKAVEIDPTIQDAQLKLGELYLLSQKPEEAKKHAEIFLTSSPQDPKGHLLRGRSLIQEKAFEEGISELKKSLELDPDNEQIYVDLARAYMGMKKPGEAEVSLEQGLEQHNTSSMLIVAMGDLLLVQGKRQEAERQFRRALELEPDNDALYAKLGKYYLATQKWKAAEEVYQKFAKQKPESDIPQVLLGDFYTFLGSGPKALEHFQKAIDLNPTSIPARNALLNFYLDNRNWKNAEELIAAALQKTKTDPLVQTFQARLLLGQGKVDDAISLFQKVLKRESKQAMAHHYLGVAYATKNEISQALYELNEAVTFSPRRSWNSKGVSVSPYR